MSYNNIETFCPSSQKAWRDWLSKNHISKPSVWVVFYKKASSKPSLSWSQAVDEALCYGWIDSIKKAIDDEKFMQFFSQRKPKSTWSKINKDKVEVLIEKGLMTKAGYATIKTAKENGSWTILDTVERLIIPEDLEKAFKSNPKSKRFYLSLSKSYRKAILQWIVLAKRAETREKRINETVEFASKGQLPNHFR